MLAALVSASFELDGAPPGYRSEWRAVGLAEAVDGSRGDEGQVPSPRSTRGATRA